VILSCSGWSCSRLISVSDVPGGNPVARDDPEHYSIDFLICPDCHSAFCDRCVPRSPLHAARCKDCSGELVDGARRPMVLAASKADCAQRFDAGLEFGRAGRPAEALAAFEEAARLRETYISAHFNRGIALKMLGRTADAIVAFGRAAQLDPSHAQPWYDIGGAYRQLGDLPRAVDAYNRALAAEPLFVAARINLAVTLNDVGRADDAIRACDRAIQIDAAQVAVDEIPHARAFAYGAKGAALLKLGRNAEALEAIDLALADREDALTYTNRATVLERLGRHDESRAATQRAQQLS
jgi:tetratricopeptide (TPR) repeat protein